MAVGTDRTPVSGDQWFGTVMRGYDRAEVDGFLGQNAARLAGLERELADAQRLRLRAVRRAEELEGELRAARTGNQRTDTQRRAPLRSEPGSTDPGSGFGARAEKLIRLAEQEATDVRTEAQRDARGLLEKTRTEAEAHRHDVEQALIARATQLEQEVAQRTANLEEQEQRAADHLAAVREQADRIRATAEAAAVERAAQVEARLREREDEAGHEVDRLAALLADVRADVASLAGVLIAGVQDG